MFCSKHCKWSLRVFVFRPKYFFASGVPGSHLELHTAQFATPISHASQSYMQKAGDTWDISPQFFLDFLQNFRLRTRNQYCTQAIAWGSTILDGGSTILDGSSTIFCRISQFTLFCRDLHYVAIYALFPQFFFGQNSLLRNITRFLHVCLKAWGSFLVLETVIGGLEGLEGIIISVYLAKQVVNNSTSIANNN